jgi:quinohemoprotein ethanol dehydrogenase
VSTNRIVWRYRWPEQCYSGSVATAGGLVFVGRNDGRLTALDSSTGLSLWQFQTGAGMNAPATVFEHDGKPYVVALSAGNVLIGSAHGDSVWLFGLDGTLPPAQPRDSESATTAVGPAPAAAESPEAVGDAGARIYKETCVPCHGVDGAGGHGGGAPLVGAKDLAIVIRTVTDGRNNMPPFGAALSEQQIRDVSAYVVAGAFE